MDQEMATSPLTNIKPLSPKEKRVLEFIELFMKLHGVAPSYQEIKDHFGLASFSSVQRFLRQLVEKGYIHVPGGNQKRAMTLLQSASSLSLALKTFKSGSHKEEHRSTDLGMETPPHLPSPVESLTLPLLGRVAAGRPIERNDHDEFIDVPASLVRNSAKTFALRVQGDSMIEDGILDGDVILVQSQKIANNGEIVVAVVDNEATVKRFFSRNAQIELRPSNAQMAPLLYPANKVDIRGVVVSLLRKF